MIPKLLFVALEFYREPRRFNNLRDPNGELPPGVTELLSAPTHCLNDESVEDTASAMVTSAQELHESVLFFIKQVLFASGGNYYRVLGVNRDAPAAQIKEHYFYLMRLFHPDKDVNNEGWDDLYAPRINEAYNVLRNPGKRAAYDASLAPLDGFNPSELGAAAPANGAPQPAGSAGGAQASNMPSSGASPSTARPWMLVASAVIVVGVLAVLGNFLVSSQSSNDLTVTTAPSAASSTDSTNSTNTTTAEQGQRPGQYNSIEDVDALRNGAEQTSYSAAEPVDAAEPGKSDSQPHQAASDAEIEAMIAQRVHRATVAVLGSPSRSRPAKSAAKPRQAQEQKVQEAPATVDNTAAIAQSPQVVDAAPVAEAVQVEQPEGSTAQAVDTVQPTLAAAVVIDVAVAENEEKAEAKEEQKEKEAKSEPEANAEAAIAAVNAVTPDLSESVNALPSAQEKAQDVALVAEKSAPVVMSQAQEAIAGQQQENAAAVIADTVTSNPQIISNDQVAAILNSFKTAYETGDARLFATLFTEDAITTDADGRKNIRKLYAEFFEGTVIKHVDFAEQEWDVATGNTRFGSALVTVVSQPVGGGEEYVARVTIAFELTLGLDPTPLIARMVY